MSLFPANELWGNRYPVCPYCKANQDEYYRNSETTDFDGECCNCGKKIIIGTRIEALYDTVGDCKLNNELPHELFLTWPEEIMQYKCKKCQREYYDWELPNGKYPKLSDGQFVIEEKTQCPI